MSRKGNLSSRSLQYTAPSTPNFLKALKAQVATSERYNTTTDRPRDELDSLVTSTSSSSSSGKRRKRDDNQEDEGLDSEDEMNGAQVVVLKEGKHLSHDEALMLKQSATATTRSSQEEAKRPTQNIASSNSADAKAKRRKPIGVQDEAQTDASLIPILDETASKKRTADPLADVKQLIRQSRPHPKHKQQDKPRAKQAQTKKLKAQSGKGLSFNFDDD
ncbi:indoleamine 2,3-dioxygenase [Pseudozyma hubeiensis SY62]|uniref:Indoleamine 2,3-dioxygenase n=1 Tax=Pseudozyma hubeiensis (strain SY62) TaxID=1305764 RepID=R9PJ89_PSEHS|nr:indoleamine 2,3-dioxygenase [Pseudozyma hubeiensis SY62]GAC98185.1 indoleamine 2,3-dioxygenase [Pseudozyma hubeiensis SY62]